VVSVRPAPDIRVRLAGWPSTSGTMSSAVSARSWSRDCSSTTRTTSLVLSEPSSAWMKL
jgi:hypothetical protein